MPRGDQGCGVAVNRRRVELHRREDREEQRSFGVSLEADLVGAPAGTAVAMNIRLSLFGNARRRLPVDVQPERVPDLRGTRLPGAGRLVARRDQTSADGTECLRPLVAVSPLSKRERGDGQPRSGRCRARRGPSRRGRACRSRGAGSRSPAVRWTRPPGTGSWTRSGLGRTPVGVACEIGGCARELRVELGRRQQPLNSWSRRPRPRCIPPQSGQTRGRLLGDGPRPRTALLPSFIPTADLARRPSMSDRRSSRSSRSRRTGTVASQASSVCPGRAACDVAVEVQLRRQDRELVDDGGRVVRSGPRQPSPGASSSRIDGQRCSRIDPR